jgi:hypothetical protein
MSIEILVLLGALCVTTAVNVMSALVLRSLAQRLITSVIAYRPARAAGASAEPPPPQEGRSPLQDVFQPYSKLTGRMADIIFQLTESRQGARDAVLVAARSIQEEASRAVADQAGSLVAADLAVTPPVERS